MTGIRTPQDLDTIFEALANKHRREIVYVLSLGPSSISKLAFLRNLSLPAIHKHIDVLEKGGMVTRRKIGQTNILSLNRASLRGLQDWLTRMDATTAARKVPWGYSSEGSSKERIKNKENK